MGEQTLIQWTDHTFNPWIGCTKVSPGCANCYAEQATITRVKRAHGLELWGNDAARHRTGKAYWRDPFKWRREAKAAGVRRKAFCASLSDVFEDRRELDAWRLDLWEVIRATWDWIDWQLLTKRIENVAKLCPPDVLKHVWIGCTVEDQKRADERIPTLLAIDCAVRFVSAEPLLGPLDLSEYLSDEYAPQDWGGAQAEEMGPRIDWVIVGGESGSDARPFDVRWAQRIMEQCICANVACFIKQFGSNAHDYLLRVATPDADSRLRFKHPKAGDWDEWPHQLRVRQFPQARPA